METPLPSKQEVLGVVWKLLKHAAEVSEGQDSDMPSCAKLAELLLKHGTAEDPRGKGLSAELLAEIESAT